MDFIHINSYMNYEKYSVYYLLENVIFACFNNFFSERLHDFYHVNELRVNNDVTILSHFRLQYAG